VRNKKYIMFVFAGAIIIVVALANIHGKYGFDKLSKSFLPTPPREPMYNRNMQGFMPQFGDTNAILTDVIDGKTFNEIMRSDRQQIYEYLKHGPNDKQHYAIKNKIMNLLRSQETPQNELTGVLLELLQNKEQDMVVRIYALQHLGLWYKDGGGRGDSRIADALHSAIQDTDSELAGAALLTMRYLAENDVAFDAAELKTEALAIVNSPTANQLSRVSAIQVAASLSEKTGDATPYLQYAESGNDMLMRMAALAAIGKSGDQSQRELLENIIGQEKPPITTAAKSALRNLSR